MEGILSYLRELNMVSLWVRLLLAVLTGAILGLERTRKRRPADSRTYILVCLGATLAMLLGLFLYDMVSGPWAEIASEVGQKTDVSRIAAQVINGIGFLGAGTILVNGKQQVKGVTTSAGLWASACMGIAIGAGFYECVIIGVLLIFLAMRVLPTFEDAIVEHAPYITLYIEFDSFESLGLIIENIKKQDAQVLDVALDTEKDQGKPKTTNAVFYLKLGRRQQHTRILISLAHLDCINSIEEC